MEKAHPFHEKAIARFAEAETAEAAYREKKQAAKPIRAELDALEQKWKTILRDARDNESEAQSIENAVYDLKAVNPNRVTETDTRTPAELLDTIAAQGRGADAALDRLRAIIANAIEAEGACVMKRRCTTNA